MRKYYTLEQATKKAYKTEESFNRDNNTSFIRDSLNLLRMYFGMKPKFYYFDKSKSVLKDLDLSERYSSPEPESFHKDDDEIDNYYRW